LGKVPNTPDAYTDLERHPENQRIPGLLIVRLDAPLYFANAALVREDVRLLLTERDPPARAILYDMSANDELDVTGSEMLEQLFADLQHMGVALLLADVHDPVQAMLQRFGLLVSLGEERIFPTVAAGVAAFLRQDGRDADAPHGHSTVSP
jgi:MFS superfamily sulfate permease-like transporter